MGKKVDLQVEKTSKGGIVDSQLYIGTDNYSNKVVTNKDISLLWDFSAINATTGALSFAGSVNGHSLYGIEQYSTTNINIAPIKGYIVNNIGTSTLGSTYVEYAGAFNIACPELSTGITSILWLNKNGGIDVTHTIPTATERKLKILLGYVVHPTGTITGVVNTTDYIQSPAQQVRDLWGPIHLINDGCYPHIISNTLTFSLSSGYIWGNGISFYETPTDASRKVILAQNPLTFSRRTQTGQGATGVTTIDPSHYDVDGTITAVGGTWKYSTNQRIYLAPNGTTFILYGQTQYTTLEDAINSVSTETFVLYPIADASAVLIAILSVEKDLTSFAETDKFKLIYASKFGDVTSTSAGGISTIASLQSAYNASTLPHIITNSASNPVVFQLASALANTSDVFRIRNNVGTITANITGAGVVSATSFVGPLTGNVTGTVTGHASLDLALAGGTITGPLLVNSSLTVMNILGNTGSGSLGGLYLQYGANFPLYLGYTGAYTISSDGSTYSGNAATATTLKNTRTIAISGGATGTATSFNGSANISIPITSVVSTYVQEPTDIRGSVSNTFRPIVDSMRANRAAFLPADQIIVEQSTDIGATWTDAGMTDAQKIGLFSETRSSVATIPLKNGVKSTDCMLRITITGMKYNVPVGTAETNKYNYWNPSYVTSGERYFSFTDMWDWITSNSDRMYCALQYAVASDSTTWVTVRDSYQAGWSGCNYLKVDGTSFGGGTTPTSNRWNWRIIFRTATNNNTFVDSELSTTYTTTVQTISSISLYGLNVWYYSNPLMYNDHLYSWDINKTAYFPAYISTSGVLTAFVSHLTNTNLAKIDFSISGVNIIRNYANTYPALTVTNSLGTANIAEFVTTSKQLEITINGFLEKDGVRFLHNFTYGTNLGGITPAGYNLFIGEYSGNYTMGRSATTTTESSYNTAVGESTLRYNTTGYANVAVGYLGLSFNTTGYENTALGSYALNNNTTGFMNIGIGWRALNVNTGGQYNLAIGSYSLGVHTSGVSNIAIGTSAMQNVTYGNYNIAIGKYGLLANSGSYNIVIGENSGRTFTNGTYNTFIGYNSGYNASQLAAVQNSIAIGYNTYTTSSNQIVLGDSDITEILLSQDLGATVKTGPILSNGSISIGSDSAQTWNIDGSGIDLTINQGSTGTTKLTLSSLGNLTVSTINTYTLGAACAKAVDTSVTQNSTNLVTSGGVYTAIINAGFGTSSIQSASKLYLVGTTSQGTALTGYSNSLVYEQAGILYTPALAIGQGTLNTDQNGDLAISSESGLITIVDNLGLNGNLYCESDFSWKGEKQPRVISRYVTAPITCAGATWNTIFTIPMLAGKYYRITMFVTYNRSYFFDANGLKMTAIFTSIGGSPIINGMWDYTTSSSATSKTSKTLSLASTTPGTTTNGFATSTFTANDTGLSAILTVNIYSGSSSCNLMIQAANTNLNIGEVVEIVKGSSIIAEELS